MQCNLQEMLTDKFVYDQVDGGSSLAATLASKYLTGGEFSSKYLPIPSLLYNFFTNDGQRPSDEVPLTILYDGQKYTATIFLLIQPGLAMSPILVMVLSDELKKKLHGLFLREVMDISLTFVRSSTDPTTYFLKSQSYPLHSIRSSVNTQNCSYTIKKTTDGWIFCCKNAKAHIHKSSSDSDEMKYRIELGSTVLKKDQLPTYNRIHSLRSRWISCKNLVDVADDPSILYLYKYPVSLKSDVEVFEFITGCLCDPSFTFSPDSSTNQTSKHSTPELPAVRSKLPNKDHSILPATHTQNTSNINVVGQENGNLDNNVKTDLSKQSTQQTTSSSVTSGSVYGYSYTIEETTDGWLFCCKNAKAHIHKLPLDADEVKYRIGTGSTVLKKDLLPAHNNMYSLRARWILYKNLVDVSDDPSILYLKDPVFLKSDIEVFEFVTGFLCNSKFTLSTKSSTNQTSKHSAPKLPTVSSKLPNRDSSILPAANTQHTSGVNLVRKENGDLDNNVKTALSKQPIQQTTSSSITSGSVYSYSYTIEETKDGWIFCCKNAKAYIHTLPPDADEVKYRIDAGSTVLKKSQLPTHNNMYSLRDRWLLYKNLVDVVDDPSILYLKYPVFLKWDTEVFEFITGCLCEPSFTFSAEVTTNQTSKRSTSELPVFSPRLPKRDTYEDDGATHYLVPDSEASDNYKNDERVLKKTLRTSLKVLGLSNDLAKIISALIINKSLPTSKLQQEAGMMNSITIKDLLGKLIAANCVTSFRSKNKTGRVIEYYKLTQSPKQIYDRLYQKNHLILNQMITLLESIKNKDNEILQKSSLSSSLTNELIQMGLDPEIATLLVFLRLQPARTEKQILDHLGVNREKKLSAQIRTLYQIGWIHIGHQKYSQLQNYSLKLSLYDIALDYTDIRASLIETALNNLLNITTWIENARNQNPPTQNLWETILADSLGRTLLECSPLVSKSLFHLSMKDPYPSSITLLMFTPELEKSTGNYSVPDLAISDYEEDTQIICCGYIPDRRVFIVWNYSTKSEIFTLEHTIIPKMTLDEIAHQENILQATLPNGTEVLLTPQNVLAKALRHWYDQKYADVWFLDEM